MGGRRLVGRIGTWRAAHTGLCPTHYVRENEPTLRLKGVEDVEVNLGSLLSVKVRRARKQTGRKRPVLSEKPRQKRGYGEPRCRLAGPGMHKQARASCHTNRALRSSGSQPGGRSHFGPSLCSRVRSPSRNISTG